MLSHGARLGRRLSARELWASAAAPLVENCRALFFFAQKAEHPLDLASWKGGLERRRSCADCAFFKRAFCC